MRSDFLSEHMHGSERTGRNRFHSLPLKRRAAFEIRISPLRTYVEGGRALYNLKKKKCLRYSVFE